LATVSTSPPPRPTDPSRDAPPRAKQNGSPPVVTGAAAGKPSPAGHTRRRLLGAVPALVLAALALGAWQLAAETHALPSYFVPAPAEVLAAFQRSVASGLLLGFAGWTLAESFTGFALGALIALPLGYAIARSRSLALLLEPYLAASQALPAVALAPLLVLWLPYGLPPVAVLCALIVFFPAVVSTALGLRTLDRDVLDAARVEGANRWQLLWHMEAPLALPAILAGLRTSLTLSITGAVVGEFVIGDQGLGGLLEIARSNFDTPLVFATLLMLALLAMALYGLARFAERQLSYIEKE
jgi:NitT/TauT family transport system permease protein